MIDWIGTRSATVSFKGKQERCVVGKTLYFRSWICGLIGCGDEKKKLFQGNNRQHKTFADGVHEGHYLRCYRSWTSGMTHSGVHWGTITSSHILGCVWKRKRQKLHTKGTSVVPLSEVFYLLFFFLHLILTTIRPLIILHLHNAAPPKPAWQTSLKGRID